LSDLGDRIDEIRQNTVIVTDFTQELPMLDGEEAVAVCPECDALVWIADPGDDGELYLMRICEVETEDCVTCSRAKDAVSDPDVQAVVNESIKELLEDD